MNCPINTQTADGGMMGRCWYHLPDEKTCPVHGDVSVEILHFNETGLCTIENKMLERKGLPKLGKPK